MHVAFFLRYSRIRLNALKTTPHLAINFQKKAGHMLGRQYWVCHGRSRVSHKASLPRNNCVFKRQNLCQRSKAEGTHDRRRLALQSIYASYYRVCLRASRHRDMVLKKEYQHRCSLCRKCTLVGQIARDDAIETRNVSTDMPTETLW